MKSSHTLLYGSVAFGLSFAASAAIAIHVPNNVGDNQASVTRLADNSDQPAWAAEATMNPEYQPSSGSPATPAADDASPPPTGGAATTSFYGGQESAANAAWAAEATMNSDYKPGGSPPAAPEQAAEDTPPPPTGGTATTSFYGGEETPANAAWAADAAMNPDYKPVAKAADAAAPVASPPVSAPDATAKPAWAAEATMNPDYKKGEGPPVVSTAAASTAPDTAASGCQSSLTAEASAAKLTFANGSSAINGAERSALDKIAAAAKSCGNVVIEVGGHTDNVGGSERNKALSEKRAEAVVSFLTKAGVDAGKLKAVGYGQEKPVSSNDTPDGRRANRRIEFNVMSQ